MTQISDVTRLFDTFFRPKWEKEIEDWKMAEFRRVNQDLYDPPLGVAQILFWNDVDK
jgi:hypothetical protein